MVRPPAVAVLVLAAAGCRGAAVSPVQKVVQLLEECKAKVQKDLDAEAKQMQEYTTFCDDELTEKGYAIKTADRGILDLTATVEDTKATIASLEDEITSLGEESASKERELANATATRDSEHATFSGSEAEMVKSLDELNRAVAVLKGGAFLQGARLAQIKETVQAISTILEATRLQVAPKEQLASFLQSREGASFVQLAEQSHQKVKSHQKAKRRDEDEDDDDDLDLEKALNRPSGASQRMSLSQVGQAPKPAAFESSAGGITETVENMQEKAEDTLNELRKKETEEKNAFELIKNGLENEIEHAKGKLSQATQGKAKATQDLEEATGKLVATQKSKAADEEYSASLKTECETKASEWADRQKSAAEEMGAIDKAKEILVSGVKEFVQIASQTRRVRHWEAAERGSEHGATRKHLTEALRALARKHHSFQLSQIAARSKSDPFVKIRGLIEEMIDKLLKEASEEATHEAFCQEEMGKSKASKADKEEKMGKFKTRIDSAETTIATLTQDITDLSGEIAVIDKAQKEATAIRNTQKADYDKASSDYKQSAEAVAKAIEVLKNYYEGASLLQVSSEHRSSLRAAARQPDFGGAKSDTAHTIISVLEMSEEDFTSLLAEAEASEEDAVKAYTKLSNENKISKAAKSQEIKAKESEVKTLKVQLEDSKEDYEGVSSELSAVVAYIEKLKPECETKAMSYEERKAAREAEIEGLKDALGILEGGVALAQTGRSLRVTRQH